MYIGSAENDEIPSGSKKRKAVAIRNGVPKLTENKRKHIERQLSAAQRDQLLLKESNEDLKFKKTT